MRFGPAYVHTPKSLYVTLKIAAGTEQQQKSSETRAIQQSAEGENIVSDKCRHTDDLEDAMPIVIFHFIWHFCVAQRIHEMWALLLLFCIRSVLWSAAAATTRPTFHSQ